MYACFSGVCRPLTALLSLHIENCSVVSYDIMLCMYACFSGVCRPLTALLSLHIDNCSVVEEAVTAIGNLAMTAQNRATFASTGAQTSPFTYCVLFPLSLSRDGFDWFGLVMFCFDCCRCVFAAGGSAVAAQQSCGLCETVRTGYSQPVLQRTSHRSVSQSICQPLYHSISSIVATV